MVIFFKGFLPFTETFMDKITQCQNNSLVWCVGGYGGKENKCGNELMFTDGNVGFNN